MRYVMAFAILLIAGTVVAAPVSNLIWDGEANSIQFKNHELVLRAGSGSGVNDVVLNEDTYSILNPFTTSLADGDLVVQILRGTAWEHESDSGVPVSGGTLFAYFVGKVVTSETSPAGDSFAALASGDTDPFGVITPDGETMLRWYLDKDSLIDPPSYIAADASQGAALERIVASITDETKYFDFGIGDAVDDSGYTKSNAAVEVTAAISGNFTIHGGFNVLDLYSLSELTFIDTGELTQDPPGSTLTSIEFRQNVEIEEKYSFTVDVEKTPWYLFSSDPVYAAAVPEPGSLIGLMGLFAVGLVGLVFRRFRCN